MKEEALKLADQLDGLNSCEPVIIKACEDMIRRLVEELDKHKDMLAKHQDIIADWDKKPLSDEEIWSLAKEIGWKEVMIPLIIPLCRAIEERHGIK